MCIRDRIYPEISIGPIIYIQRVRLITFVNYGKVIGKLNANNNRFQEKPLSLGLELKFDVNLFRQSSIFDLGIRYSYVSNIIENENPSTVEITLGSISSETIIYVFLHFIPKFCSY